MTSHHFYHNGAEMLAAKFDQSDSLDRVETVQRGAILKITVSFKLPWRETNDRHTETKVAGQQFPSHLIFASPSGSFNLKQWTRNQFWNNGFVRRVFSFFFLFVCRFVSLLILFLASRVSSKPRIRNGSFRNVPPFFVPFWSVWCFPDEPKPRHLAIIVFSSHWLETGSQVQFVLHVSFVIFV